MTTYVTQCCSARRMHTPNFVRLLLCLFGLLASISAGAAAPVEACARDGGRAICTEPITVPGNSIVAVDGEQWNYGDCDDQAAYIYRMRIWCEVAGGLWVVSPSGPTCDGAAPTF